MLTYTLKVVQLREETSNTVTVVFKQPGLKKVKYQAGQYLTLMFRINGRRYIRPYSFSSAPGVDTHLEVTVKRVPGGVVSNHICDRVKVDDVIEVMQPLGDFLVPESNIEAGEHLVLWGAGSGITPLFSIAKSVLSKAGNAHVTLVYGNRNFDSIIFRREIAALQESFPNTFTVWHFHTQLSVEESNPYLIQGRIRPELVLAVMHEEGRIADTLHYICGPAGLKESVKAALSQLEVSPERIFSEDFELTKNPEDFADISTQVVKITNGAEETVVEIVKGKSILEAGLDAALDLPYSCQIGNCLLCRGTVVSGKVKTIGLAKQPDELDESECLLCCAYPLTDDVAVSIVNGF